MADGTATCQHKLRTSHVDAPNYNSELEQLRAVPVRGEFIIVAPHHHVPLTRTTLELARFTSESLM